MRRGQFLYGIFMRKASDPSRIPMRKSATIEPHLWSIADTRRFEKRLRFGTSVNGATMLDFILLALGLGFFALSIAYAFGCDRL